MQDNEQIKWVVEYLDNRLDRLESRLDASIQRTETSLSHSITHSLARLDRVESELDTELASLNARVEELDVEVQARSEELIRISSQAGFLKNILAFVGTAVLSLLGWAASIYLGPPGK